MRNIALLVPQYCNTQYCGNVQYQTRNIALLIVQCMYIAIRSTAETCILQYAVLRKRAISDTQHCASDCAMYDIIYTCPCMYVSCHMYNYIDMVRHIVHHVFIAVYLI